MGWLNLYILFCENLLLFSPTFNHTRTLRHSWAVRALADASPIKSIADVLGHRCIDSTFIYAKADLKTLREATLPWPEKE